MVADSHTHGSDPAEFENRILPDLRQGEIDAAVLFCPVEEGYDRRGPDRLLFSSDHPFGRPSREVAKVRVPGLGPAEAAGVSRGNLGRILREGLTGEPCGGS